MNSEIFVDTLSTLHVQIVVAYKEYERKYSRRLLSIHPSIMLNVKPQCLGTNVSSRCSFSSDINMRRTVMFSSY